MAGPAARAAPSPHEIAEEVLEDVLHRGGEFRPEPAGSRSPALEGGMPELLVGGPFLRVLQDLIGLVDLFEPPLGVGIALVRVRVKFLGQPPEG